MATITDVVTNVQASYLFRDDLLTTLTNFTKNFYNVLCQKIPFENLQTSVNFNTVLDQRSYDLASLITDMNGIVNIRINYSTTSSVRLKKTHIRVLDLSPIPPSGKPTRYARWGKLIYIDPPPDSSDYNMLFRYWKKPTIDSPVGDTVLEVPDAWIELIEWEVFYRALVVLNRPDEAMNLIVPNPQPKMPSPSKVIQREVGIIPRLWNELLSTIEEREFIDNDDSINPVRMHV